MTFKIGDRVALKWSYYGYKKGAQGKIVAVTDANIGVRFEEASPCAHTCCGHTEPEHGLWVKPEKLEKILESQIVIYQNGNSVIAKDLNTKKTAEARCSPADTFEFAIGAKLALDRLLGNEKAEETPKLNCRFVVVDKDANEDSVTVGRIYEVKCGKFEDNDGGTYPRYEDLYTFEKLCQYMCDEYTEKPVKILEIIE